MAAAVLCKRRLRFHIRYNIIICTLYMYRWTRDISMYAYLYYILRIILCFFLFIFYGIIATDVTYLSKFYTSPDIIVRLHLDALYRCTRTYLTHLPYLHWCTYTIGHCTGRAHLFRCVWSASVLLSRTEYTYLYTTYSSGAVRKRNSQLIK